MFKKIDMYIIKKFLGTFFYAISLIVLIAVVFDISEKVDDFLDSKAPFKAIVFDYYLNFIPYFANLFSPLFTFIAVVFFTAKMAADTEIVAILGSGISFKRMLLPYFIAASILAILSFSLNNFVIPKANQKRLAFENTYIRNPYRNNEINIHRQIRPGEFIYFESYNNQNDIGYKFSLEKFKQGKLTYKLMSDQVMWDSLSSKWKVLNYYVRTISEKKETVVKGEVLDTVLNFHPTDFGTRLNNIETMNLFQLNQYIKDERLKGADTIAFYEIEKYNRIALPFATFILSLIGVALASRKVRGGIGLHIGVGILISFAFILFMQISNTFAIYGGVPPAIAVWIPNVLFGILGVYLLRIAPK